MNLVCGPGHFAGFPVHLNECWARVGGTESYPTLCNEPVDPAGIGLCGDHLSLYRREAECGPNPTLPTASVG